MRTRLATETPLLPDKETIVRLLVTSYFVALGLGLIDGTDMSVLVATFLSLWLAQAISSAFLVTLSAMILFGFFRRAAALILAISFFWASYVTLLSAPTQELTAFWRDLALIGALVLTYSHSRTDSGLRVFLTQRIPLAAYLSQVLQSAWDHGGRQETPSAATADQVDLYREDLEQVRVP